MIQISSISDENILGFYQPFFLYANWKYGIRDVSRPPNELKSVLNEQDLFNYALARYTFIHETRHFHDSFGTAAGISFFYAHFKQVKAFASLLDFIEKKGIRLRLPFNESFSEHSELREWAAGLVRNWGIFIRSATFFINAADKTVEPEHVENEYFVMKRCEKVNADVPTFPRSVGILSLPTRNMSPYTVFYPIGYEVLVEGNAQAIQRSLMEHECSQKLADRLIQSVLGAYSVNEKYVDEKERLRVTAQPYNITDLLISKFLRLQGKRDFQRRSVHILSDLALSTSFMHPMSEPWEVPATFQVVGGGYSFIDHLQSCKVQDIVSGSIRYPASIMDVYKSFKRAFSKTFSINSVVKRYRNDFTSTIDLVDAIVAHKIAAPLIDARIASSHEVFYSTDIYIRDLHKLPRIPIFVDGNNLSRAEYMNVRYQEAWVKYCIITDLMHQLYRGAEELDCFRAKHFADKAINLCADGDCDQKIAAGFCKGWKAGKMLPVCSFSNLLRRIGLSEAR